MEQVLVDVKKNESDVPRLPSVDRALSLLELLSSSQTGFNLSEVSRRLRIPKSTAHYLIHTMASRGYIHRCSDGRHYALGLRLSDIAETSRIRADMALLTTPILRDATRALNLTTIATILLGSEGLIIASAGCTTDPDGAWIGRHIDLHCTAQGRALIAHLPESRLHELCLGERFTPFTPRTIVNLEDLRKNLALVRERGFAVNDQDHVIGIRAVAAPVRDSFGSVVMAVTARGSITEIPAARIERLGRAMIHIAEQISRELQGSRPANSQDARTTDRSMV